jgi:1-phosphofructokinase family hexose kinase
MPEPVPAIIAVALSVSLDRILEVPDLAVGSHLRGRLVSVQPAGKATNVARLLAALGTPCVLTGFVGHSDQERFQQSFRGAPVRVELFEGEGATRENITLVDPQRGTETHIREVGPSLTADDLERLAAKLAGLVSPGAYVVFAGSLPPGVDAGAFGRLLEVCRERGARVAVDTSGPGLEAVRGARGLWLVKPNREEFSELVGPIQASRGGACPELVEGSPHPPRTPSDIRAAAGPLLDRIEQVLVTLEGDGACLITHGGAWQARPPQMGRRIVKTVGAGDAVLAGFLHAHAAGKPPNECLRLSVACGTASCFQMRAGEVGLEDVQTLLGGVNLAEIE